MTKRKKCSFADQYQAIYPPTCGCDTCWDIWDKKYGEGPWQDNKGVWHPNPKGNPYLPRNPDGTKKVGFIG